MPSSIRELQLDTLIENLERNLRTQKSEEASTSYMPRYRVKRLARKSRSPTCSVRRRQNYISKAKWLRDSAQATEDEQRSWYQARQAFNATIRPLSRQTTMEREDNKDNQFYEGSDTSSTNDFVKVEHSDATNMDSPNQENRHIDEYAHKLASDVHDDVLGEQRLNQDNLADYQGAHDDDVNYVAHDQQKMAEDEFVHQQPPRMDSPIHNFEPEPVSIPEPKDDYGEEPQFEHPGGTQAQMDDFLGGEQQQQHDYQIPDSPVKQPDNLMEDSFHEQQHAPVSASPIRDSPSPPPPVYKDPTPPASPVKQAVDEFDPIKKPASPVKPASTYKASSTDGECWAKVLDLLYWRDPKKSGVALGLTLTLLIAFATMSVISVVAYAGIVILAVALSLKVAQIGMTKLGKDTAQVEHVQQLISNSATEIPSEKVHQQVDVLIEHLNHSLQTLRRMVLVEDVVETIKFGLFLWALTYVGQWFSGITLVIIAVLAAFSVPKVYEMYQEPIDKYLSIAHGYVQKFDDAVQQNVPFLKRKQQ